MRVVSLACIFLFVALVATAQQPAPAATTASPQLTTRTATTADIATPAAASKDVIIIPAGVPHWFKEVTNPFLYYVVKAR